MSAFFRQVVALLACGTLVPAICSAQDVLPDAPFEVVTLDFKAVQAEMQIRNGQLVLRPESGPAITLDQILSIRRPVLLRKRPSWVLHLRDGQRLIGRAMGIANDQLRFESLYQTAPATVPVNAIVGITYSADNQPPPRMRESNLSQDEFVLNNGDVVRGILTEMNDQQVICTDADSATVNIDVKDIRSIRLAAPNKSAGANVAARFRLTTIAGQKMFVSSIEPKEEKLLVAPMFADPFVIDPFRVSQIDRLDGPVRFLDEIVPASSEQTSFFPGPVPSISAEVNSVVQGVKHLRYIAMTPRTSMTWNLDGTARTFRVRIAVADGRPLANCVARIKLDGKAVFEQADVVAGKLADPDTIELGAAKTLSLEVDFGQGMDVQDQLLWIEPALLK